MPAEVGRGVSIYAVQPDSLVLRRDLNRVPLPEDTSLISVYRDGEMKPPAAIDRLSPGDQVLLMSPNEHLPVLDRMFGRKEPYAGSDVKDSMGEFVFPSHTTIGAISSIYDFRIPACDYGMTAGNFMRRHIIGALKTGRRLRVGQVEIVIREVVGNHISLVAIEIDRDSRFSHKFDGAMIRFRALRDLIFLPIISTWKKIHSYFAERFS